MSDNLKLLDIFPRHTYDEWREVVDSQLKGAPFEKKLVKKTYEGINIQPMYFKDDLKNIPHMGALPGYAPFVRGIKALGSVVDSWKISQEIDICDPEEFNRAAKDSINRGQNALNVRLNKSSLLGLDPADAKVDDFRSGGLSIAGIDDIRKVLHGIDLEKMPIFIQSGFSGFAVISLITSLLQDEGKSTQILKGCIATDPIGTLCAEGTIPVSMEKAYQEMAQITLWAKDNAPNLRTIAVTGHGMSPDRT
ncbi:MAG: methylmalonyl-CoA mutase family protein [Cyanobacteriota bacterium]|nr:methylmalonyl-CoA mutase family protein [Cyanobacteriota bacterium]